MPKSPYDKTATPGYNTEPSAADGLPVMLYLGDMEGRTDFDAAFTAASLGF